MQVELLDRHRWRTRQELANAIFEWIEAFYNPTRRHSSLDYLSPIDYERTPSRYRGLTRTPHESAGPGKHQRPPNPSPGPRPPTRSATASPHILIEFLEQDTRVG